MKKNALRVLFATEDFYPSFIGGQGVWGKELVTNLAREGMNVTVLAEQRGNRKHYWKSVRRVSIHLVPFCFGNQLLLGFLEYVYFIVRYHTKQFDILHANQLTALFFLLFRPKNIGRIVVSVHNTWDQMAQYAPPIKRSIYQPLIMAESFIFHHADGLLFHTESEKQYVVKRYTLAGQAMSVVPLAAPRVRKQRRNRPAIPGRPAVILYVGRLVARKHVDTILHALAFLQKKRKHVAGVIIGQGKERKILESIAPSNARFLGFIEDASPYFSAADIFVLPSVAEGGVALAAHEAAAYGLALLLSPDAADPHILKDGENGYIVEPTDPHELAKKIENSLKNRTKFGEVSRQKARLLTWEKTASGTISFYRRLLGRGRNTL